MGDEIAASASTGLPERRVTINQLVGYNIAYFRNAIGLTQEDLGKRLGGWSGASVSAAERSWEGKRIRKFDADELVKVAGVLGVPLIGLLLPPPDAETAVHYRFEYGPEVLTDLAELLPIVVPSLAAESKVMAAFRQRILALGVSNAADPALTQGQAQELGPLERWRQELEQRIDDLRVFEREYRSRLIALLEGDLRELKAGAEDSARLDEAIAAGRGEIAPREDLP